MEPKTVCGNDWVQRYMDYEVESKVQVKDM